MEKKKNEEKAVDSAVSTILQLSEKVMKNKATPHEWFALCFIMDQLSQLPLEKGPGVKGHICPSGEPGVKEGQSVSKSEEKIKDFANLYRMIWT